MAEKPDPKPKKPDAPEDDEDVVSIAHRALRKAEKAVNHKIGGKTPKGSTEKHKT